MRLSIIFVLVMMLACQTQNKKLDKAENTPELAAEISRTSSIKTQQEDIQCNQSVCLQLRNHDSSSKSFDIYMLNSVQVAGFQCDFFGINIIGSSSSSSFSANMMRQEEESATVVSTTTNSNNIKIFGILFLGSFCLRIRFNYFSSFRHPTV